MSYKESDKTDAGGAKHPIPTEGIGCFKDRLKEVISSRGVRGFSKTCGLSEATLRSYLTGETYPTLDRLEQIAIAAGVSAVSLAFGHENRPQLDLEDDKYAYVPLYDARCSAGNGAWNEGAKIWTHLAFTCYSLQRKGLNPANLSAIQVNGDSMEPLLDDGDTVLIDHTRQSLEGEGIYVIHLDDHLYAKRLQRQFDGALHIISENKAYRDMVVPKEQLNELQIIGRVVWAGGWTV